MVVKCPSAEALQLLPGGILFTVSTKISTLKAIAIVDLNLSKLFPFHLFFFQCGVQNFRRRDQCFKCGSPKSDIDASGEGADEVSPHPTSSKCSILIL